MVNPNIDLPTEMTELGGGLQGPERVALSAGIIGRFTELRDRLDEHVSRGMAPESVKRYSQVREALVAAERVVLLAVPLRDGPMTRLTQEFN